MGEVNSSVSSGSVVERCGERVKGRGAFERASFDADYVRRLSDGDAATERHFYAYFSGLLRIKLRARLRDASAIEDLQQDTLLRVLTAIKKDGTLRDAESLGSFVNSVCNNLLFELYRVHARNRTVELREYDPSDGRNTVEEDLVSEEEQREVRTLLDELPVRDRDLLRLVFYEGANRDAICRAYNVDREYLRVLVHRAKLRFRHLLEKRQAAHGGNGRTSS